MIKLHPYNPNWPQEFESIRQEIAAACGAAALRIDHIGSTSVPGLPAKDIIDVQITVAELDEPIKSLMLAAGYPQARHTTDHHPPAMTEDPEEWRKLLFKNKPGSRPANIHVRVDGRANQRYPLLMRDYYRAFPIVAQAYGRAKQAIIVYHPEEDMEVYYAIKDPIFDIVYGGAEFWAESTGWQPE